MSGAEWISHNDARVLVGRAFYRDDWIGALKREEKDLLYGDFGPKRLPRPDGASGFFEIIQPCPTKGLRPKLDAAIGRDRRMIVQHTTVLEWLDKNGFEVLKRQYSRSRLELAVAKIALPTSHQRPPGAGKRGPVKGTIARFAEHDRSMFPQMRRLIDEGMSRWEAALQLADQLKPFGSMTTSESKATRLRKLFQAEVS
jgi:hypothetical protein